MNSEKQKTAANIITRRGLQRKNQSENIAEGDKVKLNIKRLKRGVDWNIMTDEYKKFVETNKDPVFTAHIERTAIISFREDGRWLFYVGDLMKYE